MIDHTILDCNEYQVLMKFLKTVLVNAEMHLRSNAPQTSCSKTCGASGPPSCHAPSGGPEGSPGNFMLQVPSPVVTTSGTTMPVVTGPSMPSVVSEPLPARTPEGLSEEAMLVCHHLCSDLSLH